LTRSVQYNRGFPPRNVIEEEIVGETTEHYTVLDTPEEIDWFRFLTGYRALHLEANTGMKVTRGFSAVRFFKEYGFKSRRLKPLLGEVQAYMDANRPPGVVIQGVLNTMGG
jgi:hypothetical protein